MANTQTGFAWLATDRTRLEHLGEMLERLQPHLPRDLYGELCALVYLDSNTALSADDIRRGQEIARELGANQCPAQHQDDLAVWRCVKQEHHEGNHQNNGAGTWDQSHENSKDRLPPIATGQLGPIGNGQLADAWDAGWIDGMNTGTNQDVTEGPNWNPYRLAANYKRKTGMDRSLAERKAASRNGESE